MARQARIQGTVILKIVIDKSGNVRALHLVKGHPLLAPAAFEAVRQWKYQPYLSNGDAVEVETNVQVSFVLGPKPAAEGIAGDAPGGLPPCTIGSIKTEMPENSTDSGKPKPASVSEAVMRRLRTKKIAPVYPPQALSQRIEGEVRLKMLISTTGDVEKLDLISGHPIFVRAVIDTVKLWKYKPYLLNGEPIEVETMVGVRFTLSRDHQLDGSADDAPLPQGNVSDEVSPGASHPPVPKRVRVSRSGMQALLIHKIDPVSPEPTAHITSPVVLKAVIDKSGNIESLQVVSGHPMLIPAAIEAARQWKYQPYLLNGDPMEVETTLRIDFANPDSE